MNRISWDKFNPQPMDVIKKNKHTYYCNDFMTLDTETAYTVVGETTYGWIYHWCFKYGDNLVRGRRPSELMCCLKKIKEVNNLGKDLSNNVDRQIVCYIHNLSYDYEYIKEYLREEFGRLDESMLAVGSHKIISFSTSGFNFKCSYRLTQKSLDSWTKEVGTKTRKLVGSVDHSIVRYQDTPLTQQDIDYMENDVICLDEALRIQMDLFNDTLATIPYTSTGYVRRPTRVEFSKDKRNATAFRKSQLSYETYTMCRDEFAGGITHGNRFLAEKTVKGTIRHRDFVSHYPSQQRCSYCPVDQFTLYYDSNGCKSTFRMKDLLALADKYCILAKVAIADLKLKKGITLPYAQEYKFFKGRAGKCRFVSDNGRILKSEGISIVTINEYDLVWLLKQYEFKCSIIKVYTAHRGRFPQFLQKVADDFFVGKTEYKNKEKELAKQGYADDSPEVIEAHRQLMFMKAWLNGIYGMSATDPVRVAFNEGEQGEWFKENLTVKDIEDMLEEYYKGRNNFMSYQHGVWTTANARNELMQFVELIGYENFIYADTDSIFYISTPEIEERIEKRNKELRDKGDKENTFIEVDGKRIYYNQFDLEDEDIVEFKFLHAKCYAYVLADGEMRATIAGVKKIGRNGNTRVKELGSLDNLEDGFVFKDCGGTTTKYFYNKPDVIDINGHVTEYASCAIIENCEKTLHGMFAKDDVDTFWEIAD